jgi:hypothetical protein
MIAVEVLVGIMISVVVIIGIFRVAGPITDAFANRLKLKFQELGPEEERQFRTRITELERQVFELQQQMQSVQEALKFDATIDKSSAHGETIHLAEKKERQH